MRMTGQDERQRVEVLYTAYYGRLLAFCRRQLTDVPELLDDADDFVQEALVTALCHEKELDACKHIYGWLLHVCANRIGNAKKRLRVRRSHTLYRIDAPDMPELADSRDRLEQWLTRCESDEVVAALCALLTDTERAVFDDVFLRGRRIRETAERNGMSEPAVKKAIRRIRGKAGRLPARSGLFALILLGILLMLRGR